MGTASILAALDLQCGHVIALVERRHRSKEFNALLATRPNRFCYVHTPTHGSWLNMTETLFGKMARTFLKHIRDTSWAKLGDRILTGIDDGNACPVVHRWRNFDQLSPPPRPLPLLVPNLLC